MGGNETTKVDANSQSEEIAADPAAGVASGQEDRPLAAAIEDAALASPNPDDVAEAETARGDDARAVESEIPPPDGQPAHHETSLADAAEARQEAPAAQPAASHEPPPPGAPDLILDERLSSAAAPFLYLLAIILLAVAGYLVYSFL
ncbi:hypothetical protein [Rhodomicrobium sp.]|uniref:hypothetical protein n=1 Tax=Rhodomicrobium sp. TaxID=2720632 RepID=UPI0039E3928C